MRVRTFREVAGFLDVVQPTLLAHEAENALMLGVVLAVKAGRAYGDDPPFFACVESARSLAAIAVRTPPYNLLLTASADRSEANRADAVGCIAEYLYGVGANLPGVHGTVSTARAFADKWHGQAGVAADVAMEQRLYCATEVSAPYGVPGRFRMAAPGDVDLLTEWAEAFFAEAASGGPSLDARALIDRLVAAGALAVWDDGEPVSMAARSRPTPNGVSISLVYTAPQSRRRGYATACVATLTQRLLDSGKAFCTLFTDLANPTSNKIYQRIGYRRLDDFVEIRFERSPCE
jgi:predicted GNAT family acetyltransferase